MTSILGKFSYSANEEPDPTSYVPQQWHGTLIYWAIIVLGVVVNVGFAKWLPKLEGFLYVSVPTMSRIPHRNPYLILRTGSYGTLSASSVSLYRLYTSVLETQPNSFSVRRPIQTIGQIMVLRSVLALQSTHSHS